MLRIWPLLIITEQWVCMLQRKLLFHFHIIFSCFVLLFISYFRLYEYSCAILDTVYLSFGIGIRGRMQQSFKFWIVAGSKGDAFRLQHQDVGAKNGILFIHFTPQFYESKNVEAGYFERVWVVWPCNLKSQHIWIRCSIKTYLVWIPFCTSQNAKIKPKIWT